jgi:N-acetylmuramate 1-kinase
MSDAAAKHLFLAQTPCAGWRLLPLAGDASTRSYDRLLGPEGQTAILMDAGPDAARSVPPFLAIAGHLRTLGLCPPEVLARSDQPEFLLLGDLGPVDLARHLADHPQDEGALYRAAVDVLLVLSRATPPDGLTQLTPAIGAAMLEPLFDWFAPGRTGAQRGRIETAVADGLAAHAGLPDTLSLRDFHAENLIWRPHLKGTDRIGLLDFQDAFIAPAAYDLVSLLRDARRDVSEATREQSVAQFAKGLGQPPARVEAACAILGLQRNLRILGIFARLAERDGKAQYRRLIPRVLGHVRADLGHPAVQNLRSALAPVLESANA